MGKRILWLGLGLFCGGILLAWGLYPGPALAQSGESCDAALSAVSAEASTACAGLGDGMVCSAGSAALIGTEGQALGPGQQSLEGLQRVDTAGFDAAGETIGVSVLRVPGLGGRYLSAVLFGEASLIEVEAPPIGPACTATSIGTVNVRAAPSTDAEILGQMTVGQTAPITARLADGTWWQITWEGQTAWIFAELAQTSCDPAAMLVADPTTGDLSGGLPAPAYQYATLTSGFGAPVCANAPRGGLLLQSEAGGAAWRLNEIEITLDGTALIQAGANDVLVVSVLEGNAGLDFGQIVRTASAGQMLRVPLLNGAPVGLPGPALEMVSPDAAGAPLALLPRAVTAPPSTTVPVAVEAGTVPCDLLPQMISTTNGGVARLTITADSAQRVRISAAGEGLQRLSVTGLDGTVLAQAEVDETQTRGVLAVDVTLPAGGAYTLVAEGAASQMVTFGVTCGLPEVTGLPSALACEGFLLRWEHISGNEVQFTGPEGATISAIVTHDLPSEGPALRLDLLSEDGDVLGEAGFLSVGSRQAAGPLEAALPATGTYTLHWDGDPFNVVSVEAVCVPPQPVPTETPAP